MSMDRPRRSLILEGGYGLLAWLAIWAAFYKLIGSLHGTCISSIQHVKSTTQLATWDNIKWVHPCIELHFARYFKSFGFSVRLLIFYQDIPEHFTIPHTKKRTLGFLRATFLLGKVHLNG